jgi:surface antigen
VRTLGRHARWYAFLGIAVGPFVGCAGFPASEPVHADLTDSDVTLAVATMEAALEDARYGESRAWRNPETGHAGAVMPRRTYVSGAGSYCRVYQETLTANGRSATYQNTACRDDDGMWHWVD